MSARTAIRLTVEVTDGYRKALARVYGWDADSRGRAMAGQ